MAHNTFINKKLVFNKVYEQNWKALYVFAFNIMKDKQSAEDIIQEIFIDFWLRMNETDIQNFTAYLFQAVRNQCAKKLKSKKLTAFELEIFQEVLQLIEEEPAIELSKELLIEEVKQKACEILPKKCLDIFTLRFYDNMTIKEIAEQKNLSISTVENQINKALKLLKAGDNYRIKLLGLLIVCSSL